MSQCEFCMIEDENTKPICCLEGIKSCPQCILTGNVTTSTKCTVCNKLLGRKVQMLVNEIQQTNTNYGQVSAARFNVRQHQNQQDFSMAASMKKMKGQRNTQEYFQQQGYGPYYPQFPPYGQNMSMMNPNFGPKYMPYGYGNQWNPGYFGPMPPLMMGNYPQYSQHGWDMETEENHQENVYGMGHRMPIFENQFERETYMKMIRNTNRGVMPCHVPDQEEERERYIPGKHSIGNTVYRAQFQNKTTDILEESTVKNKSLRINRSNSLNNFNLRR